MIKKNETRNTSKKRLTTETPPRPVDIDKIPEPSSPSKNTRWTNRVALIALLLVALSLGIFFKWAAESETILEIKNSPFPTRILQGTEEQPGVVILLVDVCKTSDIVGETRTSFVSKTLELLQPIAKEKLNKGCLNNIEVPIVIPNELPPDTYKIKFHSTYNINPLKRGIINESESREFTVGPDATTPKPAQ